MTTHHVLYSLIGGRLNLLLVLGRVVMFASPFVPLGLLGSILLRVLAASFKEQSLVLFVVGAHVESPLGVRWWTAGLRKHEVGESSCSM